MKYLFKLWAVFLIMISAGTATQAQLFTGGNIGFQFDNNGTVFDASPIVGYRINKLEAGVAPFFTYIMPKDFENEYLYGGRLFTKYHVIQGLFLHAEFEGVNMPPVDETNKRVWSVGLPVGVGYEQRVGVVRIHASVLYDVLLDPDSGKKNPIYRGGIVYDF